MLVKGTAGREVVTIEGISHADGDLHPMPQAFMDHDAFQCGYCTLGQIMSAIACVQEGHAASQENVHEFMSGKLCRCAAYSNIIDAISEAGALMAGQVTRRRRSPIQVKVDNRPAGGRP